MYRFFWTLEFLLWDFVLQVLIIWQPSNPDLYLSGPVKLIFLQLSPTPILPTHSKIIAPQILSACITCQPLYQWFHMYVVSPLFVVFNRRIDPILSTLS